MYLVANHKPLRYDNAASTMQIQKTTRFNFLSFYDIFFYYALLWVIG